MFDSIRQESGLTSIAYFSSLVLSLIAHMMVVLMLVIVPLCLIKGLPSEGMLTFLLNKPELDMPDIQPPPVTTSRPASGSQAEGSKVFRTEIPDNQWTAPDKIPKTVPPPSNEEILWIGMDMPGGNGGGKTGLYGDIGKVINALTPGIYLEEPLSKPPDLTKKPIRIGVLNPSRLLLQVPPVYPKHALATRVSGKVYLEAIINEEGNVTDIKVLEGHPLLQASAVDAVRQWKYTPTIQNGEPIPVLATIIINFRID